MHASDHDHEGLTMYGSDHENDIVTSIIHLNWLWMHCILICNTHLTYMQGRQ